MGRKRQSNPLDLPPRLYWHHGAFWYRHRIGKPERLGTDAKAAKERAKHFNDPEGIFGTVAWYYGEFLVHFERQVKAGAKAQRTLDDYTGDKAALVAFFGKMSPANVAPHHVAEYLDVGLELGRGVAANREKAALSSCFTWMIRSGHGGLKVNPCRGVRRNLETPRERYVDDLEYLPVLKSVPESVRNAMQLAYLTLQRPSDILGWTRANLVKKTVHGVEKDVLAFRQGKTGKAVDIEIKGPLAAVIAQLRQNTKVTDMRTFKRTLVQTRGGTRYTDDGIGSIMRRHQAKAGVGTFGLQDLKAKGATDMYLAGVPLEVIQVLCGHDSVTTTEIYVKRHMQTIATPNMVNKAKPAPVKTAKK